MQVAWLEIEPNRMLTATDVHCTVGGEKAEPVGFLVGINDLEEVALHLARIIPWTGVAKSKLADLMLDGSPCSAQNTGNVIARECLIGVEFAQQRFLLARPGTKNFAPDAELLSFVPDCPPVALEIAFHLFMRDTGVGIYS